MEDYIVNGVTLTQAHVDDLLRQVEARKKPTFWRDPAGDAVWRESAAGTAYGYVADPKRPRTCTGQWTPCTSARPLGCRQITEVEATALITPKGPQPVVGQVYQSSDVEVPTYLWRMDSDCDRYSCDRGKTWHTGAINIRSAVQDGKLIPYVPPTPTFAVGDWVQRQHDQWPRPKQIARRNQYHENWWVTRDDIQVEKGDLRHATPDEIAAAKRIGVKDRLIVRGNKASTVWQWKERRQQWICLSDNDLKPAFQLWDLTTDHYTVLDSYTVTGAK